MESLPSVGQYGFFRTFNNLWDFLTVNLLALLVLFFGDKVDYFNLSNVFKKDYLNVFVASSICVIFDIEAKPKYAGNFRLSRENVFSTTYL